MSYKYILLDADNTLFDFNASQRLAFFAMLSEFGIEPREDYLTAYHNINDRWWKKLERRETDREQLKLGRFVDFAAYAGIKDVAPADMDACYRKHLGDNGIELPGAVDFLKKIRDGHELFIVTNGMSQTQHGRFDRSRVRELVNGLYISEELGADKPSVRYFELVLEDIARQFPDMTKEQCLVVGDSLTSDIKGANNAGLPCCWYDREGKYQPEKELSARPDYIAHSYDEIAAIIMK